MSRARIALLSALAVVTAAIAAVVVVASIDQRALTERVVARVVVEGSAALGREITFGSARGSLLPSPRVTLTEVAIAGRPGEPPLLEADELYVHLRLWPIVRSLGREVAIDEVAFSRPTVRLVRDEEGSWSFEGLGTRPAESGAPGAAVSFTKLTIDDGTVEVIDGSSPGRESAVALTRLDVEAADLGTERSTFTLRGALASDEQNVDVELAVEPRGAGAPQLDGTVRLDDVALVELASVIPAGVAGVVRGGEVDLEAEVATTDDGEYDVEATASLVGVRLRGQPASGSLRASARVDPEAPARTRTRITRLALRGPGVDLTGSGSISLEPRRVSFDVAGSLLDLDVLLAALPGGDAAEDERSSAKGGEPEAAAGTETPAGAEPPAGAETAVLPKSLRRSLAGTAAVGTVRFDRVVRGRLELFDVVARARLQGGVLELEQGRARLYGGTIVADGTRADLRAAVPEWTVEARIDGADLGAMTRELSGDQALLGRLGGTLDVSGSGAAWEHVQRSVRGDATLEIRDGALTTGDVGRQVTSVAAEALRLAGRGEARLVDETPGRTELDDVRLAFRVENGALVLRQPMVAELPFGSASLRGSIGLDRSLDLEGRVALSPETVTRMAGVELHEPIEVPLAIGGTLSQPEIAPAAPERLAEQLVRSAAREGTRALQEEVEDQVRDRAGDAVGDTLRGLGDRIFGP